ncbi:MAG: glutathione S-transferase family protein [Gammaproteobacteria bacterium]|nr:glutathione S-transferase family protein [Gammaproteobacteria bacterium]NIR84486.1 glutathione S-transferase family protein [Gammaproteobacteria bacterium]NIR90389.1 glutathione S-transferase family protein [Gammaproteobacteria bacterium]NIU05537.1 glutathione S-transferase family protein [Gammaproteobacteria bacterium]NIV52676.1 glutathione S-transferase family protein [Gammaproteobacteria bacterium]
MAHPVIYGPAFSTYVRSVRLALEEKGAPYDLVEIDILQGEKNERHPFGKVPAFEHDGFQLYETCAIERYVDEAFDGPRLQSADVRQRARMTQVVSVIDSYTYAPLVGQLVIQRLIVPMRGGTPDEAAIEAALPQVRRSIEALEDLLGGQQWFGGDAPSLADLHVAPVFWYFVQTPESKAILESTPNLRRWWDAMSARESMRRTEPQLG